MFAFFGSLLGLFSAMAGAAGGSSKDSGDERENVAVEEEQVVVPEQPVVVPDQPVVVPEQVNTVEEDVSTETTDPVAAGSASDDAEEIDVTFEAVEKAVDKVQETLVENDVQPNTVVGSEQNIETNAGAEIDTGIELEAFNQDAVEVMTGRVHAFELDGSHEIASVVVTGLPDFGNVTVNPDNSLVLVLSGETATGAMSFSYDVTYNDGAVQSHTTNLNVVEGTQDAGWGQGGHYMLETDENDDLIVETGDNHRPVYVTNSDEAVTIADIAALEGLSESEITTDWLVDHPEYGGSETMALSADIGLELWADITSQNEEPTSNWLLFERGYDYDGTSRLVGRGTDGEDELHPLHITAWGEGERPILNDRLAIYQESSSNIVFSDVEFDESLLIRDNGSHNIIFDDVRLTGDEGIFEGVDKLTIRNSEIIDVFREEDRDGDGVWEAHEDRISGLYVAGSEGTLIEGNLIDQNGWEEGGQPASQWSHNVYIQYNTTDVTFSNNIVSNGASFGAQLRGGTFAEDNVFVENNVAVSFVGGDYKEFGTVGNYTLFQDNLVTSPSVKDEPLIGAKGWGVYNNGELSVLVDNIVAHIEDPASSDELANEFVGERAQILLKDPLYNDTIVYNYDSDQTFVEGLTYDANTEGLDTDILDETTIQNFAAQLLGQDTATIDDLVAYLRAQSDGAFDDVVDAELITEFFQTGFGIDTELRTEATTVRFVPDALADGVRWDNKLNWDTNDLPNTVEGDSVNLAGNWVNYSGTNTLKDIDLGTGGKLYVAQGKLTVEGDTTVGANGGSFDIAEAGQVWINGYNDADQLDINVDGGRFANTGDLDGSVQITATDGQTILASNGASTTLEDGSDLRIIGDEGSVGFDGTDNATAVLRVGQDGTLTFEADEDGELGSVEEFRSGAFGDDSDVESGINLQGGTLRIALDEGVQDGTDVLLSADEIVGSFESIEIYGLTNSQDAEVSIDYQTDTLSLTINDGGSGEVSYNETGSSSDVSSSSQLWDALTSGMGTLDERPPEISKYDDADDLYAE